MHVHMLYLSATLHLDTVVFDIIYEEHLSDIANLHNKQIYGSNEIL